MTAYTSVQAGAWDDPATWGTADYPRLSGDTASIGHAVTAPAVNIDLGAGTVSLTGTGSLAWGATTMTCGALAIAVAAALDTGTGAWRPSASSGSIAGSLTVPAGGSFLFTNPAATTIFTGPVTIGAGATFGVDVNASRAFRFDGNSPGAVVVRIGVKGGARATAGNVNAGSSAQSIWSQSTYGCVTAWDTDFKRIEFTPSLAQMGFFLDGCEVDNSGGPAGTGVLRPGNSGPIFARGCWIGGAARGVLASGQVWLDNVVFGAKRDGSANANSTSDIHSDYAGDVRGRRVRCLSSTQVASHAGGVRIEDFGMADGVGTPGDWFFRPASGVHLLGYVARSAVNPPSGATHHARFNPVGGNDDTTNLDHETWLALEFVFPVAAGEDVSVEAEASRGHASFDADESIEVTIDPAGLLFTPVTVFWDLVNVGQYYALPTCEALNASDDGFVRVKIRVRSGVASFIDVGNVVVTVGSKVYTVNMSRSVEGVPEVVAPAGGVIRRMARIHGG